jgi:hypothetical protein
MLSSGFQQPGKAADETRCFVSNRRKNSQIIYDDIFYIFYLFIMWGGAGGWWNRPCKAEWATETTWANNRALTLLDCCDLSKDVRMSTSEVDSSLQLSSPCQGTQYQLLSRYISCLRPTPSSYTLGETPIRTSSLGFASLSALLCNYPRSLKTFSRLWERQIRLSKRRNRVRTLVAGKNLRTSSLPCGHNSCTFQAT